MKFWIFAAVFSMLAAVLLAPVVMGPGTNWFAGVALGFMCVATVGATLAAAARMPRVTK